MMGKIRGSMMALALALATMAASVSTRAQAPAQGQPAATPQGQPAPTAQAQPATPAPVEEKKLSTNLGRDFTKVKPIGPNPIAPYTWASIPPPQFTNSPRIQQRVQDGKLAISLQDAIELALENNTDIMVQRYYPSFADLDLLRTEAGAGARGVGNENAPGVFGNNPAIGAFDPAIVSSVSVDSRHSPVNNPLIAGTGTSSATLASQFLHTTTINNQYVQAFTSGTSIAAALNTTRQTTTSSAQFFSPSVQTVGSLTVSQQLLNGWGFGVNRRAIRVARIVRKGSDLAFAQSVLTDINNVQNLYWELVFARGNVGVNIRAVEEAQRLYDDNQRQVEIGTLAPLELVRAEAQLATAQQGLIAAQTTQLQQQIALMNVIAKDMVDPAIYGIEVVPLDTVVAPPPMENLPLSDAVKEAMTNRPDVQLAKLNLTVHDINLQSVRSALLPTLTLNGFVSGTGLSGDSNPLSGLAGNKKTPVVSGFPNALNTVFVGDFPEYQATVNLTIPIRNRAAQADVARALLLQQQGQAQLLQLQDTVAVDVQNATVLLKQARTAVDAAVKNRELNEQALAAEQTKFQLGASTIFLVVTAQQALSVAASAEVRAQVNLVEAAVNFQRAMGRTLEANRIDLSDAQSPNGAAPNYAQIPGTTVTGELAQPGAATESSTIR